MIPNGLYWHKRSTGAYAQSNNVCIHLAGWLEVIYLDNKLKVTGGVCLFTSIMLVELDNLAQILKNEMLFALILCNLAFYGRI